VVLTAIIGILILPFLLISELLLIQLFCSLLYVTLARQTSSVHDFFEVVNVLSTIAALWGHAWTALSFRLSRLLVAT